MSRPRRGVGMVVFVSFLFGFVFLLLAMIIVAAVLGSEPPERRALPDWAPFAGAGVVLLAGAACFGMSLRLALRERDRDRSDRDDDSR